jgi:hypothetical protein
MPAKNPRLTITLEPSTAAQLRRLSELTGNSQSALISELLTSSNNVFSRLIRVLEAANDAKATMTGQFSADLQAAQARIEDQLGLMLDLVDEKTQPLLDDVEKVRRRTRRTSGSGLPAQPDGANRGGSTPMSNRGVRFTPKTAKPPMKRGG